MIEISHNTSKALADAQLQRNLDSALSHTLEARDRVVAEVENWEELRRHAHRVKAHTMARLDHYLEELEDRIQEKGGKVIWCRNGREATDFITALVRRKGIRQVIKSKSMTGEEIHLNQALQEAGLEPVETDLGEYIVQMAGQAPSHIIAPALHLSRSQVGDLFAEKLGTERSEDPARITAQAREALRQRFVRAEMGISGVNFAVAESGTLVVVENEGNARLCMSAPRIHVALMGIEKVIPRGADLSVFLTLLIRSATGQKMSSYVNFIQGARQPGEKDGPEEFYLLLLDNGRSRILADEALRQTLYCLRCGACQNVCPVYQRIGGHAYGSTYQGPIGAILTPQLLSLGEAPEHPFASTLCGACAQTCPVKIEIPQILLELRRRVEQKVQKSKRLNTAFRLWSWTMRSPGRYRILSRWGRSAMRLAQGGKLLRGSLAPWRLWSRRREMPQVPAQSFRESYPGWKRRRAAANQRPPLEK